MARFVPRAIRATLPAAALLAALLPALLATEACSLLTDLSGLSGPAAEGGTSGTTDASSNDANGGDGGDGGDGAASTNDGGRGYAQAVLDDAPLAYLRLGDKAGDVAKDATGNGHDGMLGSGQKFGVPGVIVGDPDTALHLDGSSSGIDLGLGKTFDFIGNQSYSLEIWAKVDRVDMQYRHFVKKSANPPGGREAYGFFVWNGRFTYERIIGGLTKRVELSSNLVEGRRAHLVATYDGALLRIYIDGVEVGSEADARPAGAIAATMHVGCSNGFDEGVIDGDLDEVAIYDKALPAARIKRHFDIGHGPP